MEFSEDETNIKKSDDIFYITNRPITPNKDIDIKDIEIENIKSNKLIKSLNMMVLFNKNEKYDKIRERLKKDLEDSKERLLKLKKMIENCSKQEKEIDLKSIERNIEIQSRISHDNSEKMKRVIFLKKREYFKNTIKIFYKELKEQENNCNKTQEIFQKLLELKSFGFYVDKNFTIDLNPNYDNLNIILQNKYILNFKECLRNEKDNKEYISKHNFILSVSKNNNLDNNNINIINNNNFNKKNYQNINQKNDFILESKFYDDFSKKYKIVFEFNLKVGNLLFINFDYTVMDDLINSILQKKIKLNLQQIKNNSKIENYLQFYFKYLLYKFFKLEINEILKVLKKEGKNNIFSFKQFTIIVKQTGNQISIEAKYNSLMQLKIKCAKILIEDFNNIPIKSKEKLEQISKEKDSHFGKLIKIFIDNLLYDIRIFNRISNFNFLIKNNPSISDLIDLGLIAKNVTKISIIILRRLFYQQLKTKINDFKDFNVVIRTEFGFENDSFLCELNFKKKYLIKSNQVDKVQLCILFNYEGEIELEIKKPYSNQILYLDKEKYVFQKFKRIDFNYLLCLIDNILTTELS